jgi:5'-nucleotidase
MGISRRAARTMLRFVAGSFAAVIWSASLAAANTHLTILHTNDLHDHLRSGSGGVGGIAYVAGYIKAIRSDDPAVLVLDAGDVTEKGDLVAFKTHSLLTYEILRRIGYDAVTIGNHDADAGIDWLHRYEEELGQRLVCLNLVDAKGAPIYEVSRIVSRHGLRIGLIGALVPQDTGTLDLEATGRQLAAEANRLISQTSLLIAICHAGPEVCATWSRMAPAIKVFISGHTHETLQPPRIVTETGAQIVQAGCDARQVGRLDLEFDAVTQQVVDVRCQVVALEHGKIQPDDETERWVAAQEMRLCPNAGKILTTAPASIGPEIAWLAAEAMRVAGGVDLAFCNPGHVVRDSLAPGPVTVNDLFLTGGQRGDAVIESTLTGSEVTAYLNALANSPGDQTAWAGFAAAPEKTPAGKSLLRTNLLPDHRYRMLMPAIEWEKRFLRAAKRLKQSDPSNALAAHAFIAAHSRVTFIDSLVALLESRPIDRRDIAALIAELRARAQPPKLENAVSVPPRQSALALPPLR